MGFIGSLIGAIISGGIIGALGRLIVPGEQSLSVMQTVGIGIGASFVVGLLTSAFLPGWLVWVLSALAAAGFIYWYTNRNRAM